MLKVDIKTSYKIFNMPAYFLLKDKCTAGQTQDHYKNNSAEHRLKHGST